MDTDRDDNFYAQLTRTSGDFAASFALGERMQIQGKLSEAETAYRQALTTKPDLARAHDSLGVVLSLSKRFDQAEACFQAALASDPDFDQAACNLNNLLVIVGREQEALALCEARLPISKAPTMLLESLAKALADNRQTEAAESCYQRALGIEPDSVTGLNDYAAFLFELGRLGEAELLARRGAVIAPDYMNVNLTLGAIVDALQRKEEAAAIYRRILSLYPDCAEAYAGLGHLADVQHLYQEAEKLLLRAIALDFRVRGAHNALGRVYLMTDRFAEARQEFCRELQVTPNYALSQFNLSCLNLLEGNFSDGWAGFETRWNGPLKVFRREFDAPCWDGGDLAGKTLLIHHEQGLGDTIHLIRYALLAATTADKVFVVVQKPLYRLLQGMPGLRIVTRVPAHYDAYCYMASLPLSYRTTAETIPAPVPYISVPGAARDRWSEIFVADTSRPRKPRIGITWAGNAVHSNDQNRSIPFETLGSLLSIAGVQWVSLQKERRPDEMDDLVAERGWLDPMGEIEDFEDTAAIVDQLDLVICVDTSVAHLAGALGKPVWLLLPATPDWRWLLEREDDSPWYPTMRLFRQTYPEGWVPVIDRVTRALLKQFPELELADAIAESGISLAAESVRQEAREAQQATAIWTGSSATLPAGESTWLDRLKERYQTCPFWYHRIELPGNIATPGWAPLNRDAYDLPERLDGLRVLDVGAWDGYWTFEALRRGAREVVAIDDFSDTLGVAADKPWRDWRNFDVCREALGYDASICRRETMSVYDIDEASLGRFDVVFFFGVFNQLRDPLGALEKVTVLCDQTLYVEAAVADDFSPYRGGIGRGHPPGEMLMEYYPDAQLGNSSANYWAPTMQALAAMIHKLGFAEVEGWKLDEHPVRGAHCRGFVKGSRRTGGRENAP